MNETFRLGRIAGLRVGVNWSVAVILLLVFAGLAAGRFPAVYPDRSTANYVAAGAVGALLFLASLLAHELAHAVVARRNGVEVEGITLWLFGGVAKLEGDSPDPGADLRIAGVGPLTSIGLGVLFGGLAALVAVAGATGVWQDVLAWLGVINLVLAIFNLAPAAPLDGGRILRALLWRRRGDRTSAAISAAKAGRVFGFLLVGLGLAQLVLVPGIGGIWLMLIGWFVVTAAGAEEQHVRLQRTLGDVPVAEVMSSDPTTVPSGTTVQALLDDYVLTHRYSAFPVVDDVGRPQGLVTLNRIKDVDPQDRGDVAVEQVACRGDELATVDASTPVPELLTQLQRCGDGRALVVDEQQQLVGIVSPTDISRMLQLIDLRDDREREHV